MCHLSLLLCITSHAKVAIDMHNLIIRAYEWVNLGAQDCISFSLPNVGMVFMVQNTGVNILLILSLSLSLSMPLFSLVPQYFLTDVQSYRKFLTWYNFLLVFVVSAIRVWNSFMCYFLLIERMSWFNLYYTCAYSIVLGTISHECHMKHRFFVAYISIEQNNLFVFHFC